MKWIFGHKRPLASQIFPLWYPIFKFGHIASVTRLFYLDTYSKANTEVNYHLKRSLQHQTLRIGTV